MTRKLKRPPMPVAPARRPARPGARASALLVAAVLAGCADDDGFGEAEFEEPETQLDYEVEIEGAPDEETAELIEASIALSRRQEDGAQSLAFLRRRAQGDVETVQKILRSRGYYEGEVEIDVDAPEGLAEDGSVVSAPEGGAEIVEVAPEAEAEEPAEEEAQLATARVIVRPGPQFTVASHDFQVVGDGGLPPEALDAADLGSPVASGAVASRILSAEGAAVGRLKREGRPYATFEGRDAVADLEADSLEVTSTVTAGPFQTFGPVSFSGAPNVKDAYLLTYVPWEEGDIYDEDLVDEFQKELFATSLFSGAAVRPPETPPDTRAAPIAVSLEEAPFRSVGAGLRYSTDDGPAVRGFFEHRNLFRANETVTLTAEASIDEQIAGVAFIKPQWFADGQDFVAGLELRHVEEDRFDELGATLTFGVRRELSDFWTVSAGGLIEASLINDADGETEAYLFGIPLVATYDDTESELDPVSGYRLRLEATPFAGTFDDAATTFVKFQMRASAYQDLLGDGRFVLAERVRLGTIFGEDRDGVPDTRLFYSGGGGSVRGYAEDIIGPLDDDNDPLGGLSVAEAGLELRARVVGDLGVAIFSEAGIISDGDVFDFDEEPQVAVGVGLRYYSPIGPVRVDVGFPVNGRDVDDSFQAYFSIGQAF